MEWLRRWVVRLLLGLSVLIYAGEALFFLSYQLYSFGAPRQALRGLLTYYAPALLGTFAAIWLLGRVTEPALFRAGRPLFGLRLARYLTVPQHRELVASALGMLAGLLRELLATPLPWLAFWVLPTQNTYGSLWVNIHDPNWPTPYAVGAGVLLGASWALRRLYKRWQLRIPSFAPGK